LRFSSDLGELLLCGRILIRRIPREEIPDVLVHVLAPCDPASEVSLGCRSPALVTEGGVLQTR